MRTAFTYNIIRRWAFLFATVFMIVMNFLSNSIPFGGRTMAEVSASYPTLVTPAGYAFSIWGIIYITLLVFALFQLKSGKDSRFYNLIWPFYILTVVANVSWLLAFQFDFIAVSLIIMFVLLLTLIRIFELFYRFKDKLGTTRRYFFQVPFSLYFGWVCVATIVNSAVYISSLDLAFFQGSENLFAMVMVIVAAVLGMAIFLSKHDYVFAFAITWGIVAIWVGQDSVAVMTTAKFAAIGLIATMIYRFATRRIKISKYGRKRARVN